MYVLFGRTIGADSLARSYGALTKYLIRIGITLISLYRYIYMYNVLTNKRAPEIYTLVKCGNLPYG